MATIPGASQFLGAATLANRQGIGAQTPTLLGASDTASLLDAGRGVAGGGSGIGLSSGARAINQQFLNNTTDINALLSLAVGPSATVEGLQGEILALRASLPASAISSAVSGIEEDNGSVSESGLGTEVNQEA